jgi:cation transport protein ChaC
MTTTDIEIGPFTEPSAARRIISRSALQDGSFLAAVRAVPGLQVRSDAEIEASLTETLAARPTADPIWVFGYGSLMWNPAFAFAERRRATLHGWHRRFCLWMRLGRGTAERPGLTLALDRGGMTRGVALRLPEDNERSELMLVWRREMFGGAYLARWVTLSTPEGPAQAMTFVANRAKDTYAHNLAHQRAVECVAAASGPLGTCAEYLFETVEHLKELGVKDRGLERMRRSLIECLQASPAGRRDHLQPDS